MDLVHLDQNPFVSGGMFLMLFGGVLYYLKRLPHLITHWLERFLILRIEILDDDEAYQWMQVWLAAKLQRTLSVSVVTRRRRPHESILDEDQPPANLSRPAVFFVPAVGTHFFWYRERFVVLHRNREDSSAKALPLTGVGGSALHNLARDKESVTLRILSRNRELARELIEECRRVAMPDDGRVEIRVPNYYGWSLGARIKPRPLDSVILDGRLAQELLADVQKFLAGKEWYEKVGVPYRRGYLLHGPPGNGKTSVVKALAGSLRRNIYLLMLSDSDLNDQRLNDLLAKVADNNLILLEDVDCAFAKRKAASKKQTLSFSGLLNALDGVASTEGRLLVMTTNHVERLDPALIRPGRVDVKLYFDNATSEQARRLFERFFPQERELGELFAQRIEDGRLSMAALQDHLMLHRDDPRGAAARVGQISSAHSLAAARLVSAAHGEAACVSVD